MGNYQCCFSSTRSKPSCLLDQDGNLRRLELPVGAAELMLEFPGHVVSSAADLHRTGRLVALRADDELLAGNLYLMVPVSEINRKVTEAEMAAVESASKKKGRGGCGKGHSGLFGDGKSGGGEVENSIGGSMVSGKRFHNCSHRLWNPVLEPILED